MSEEKSKSLTLSSGGKLSPLVPTTFDEVARLAKLCIIAGMFKPAYKKDNEEFDTDKAQAQATMAILQGMDCGIAPMQAVQNIAVINGRCCIWGALVPALLWHHKFRIKEWIEGEGEDRIAYCEVTRPDGEVILRSFSVKQARQAGLWDDKETVKRKDSKGGWYDKANDSPWHRFPERMLSMRARGFATNDGASDVLRGLAIREEIEEPRDIGEVIDTAPMHIGPPPPPPPPETGQKTNQDLSDKPAPVSDKVSNNVKSEDMLPQPTEPTESPEQLLKRLDDELTVAQDIEALSETYQHYDGQMEDTFSSQKQWQAANALYLKHEARINGQSDMFVGAMTP